jgi:transcriptional regulator with PAS, ATPase and Fis domain
MNGALPGALKEMRAFEQATGVRSFDEFAEMNADLQAKLLRAIENKNFRRLGGTSEISVDVRVVAATNKDIPSALASGELREDLYHRFSVIELVLPPLRERTEDIAPLIDHFLELFARQYARPRQSFSDESLEILRAFRWPGNVRELRNAVERVVVTCPDELITPQQLPSRITQVYPEERSVLIPVGTTFEEAERRIILKTLECYENNKSKAARVLGLSRRTLHNKLQQFYSARR